ncbi:LysR family transcriptional regulator [Noviherbaspirillum denitrificans]|uniref:LysR family transcriptional regulator n=1 Tax=Noviherbaspirillum denitrificans TaxID=1968433 RepID=A0A254TH76_9BURK|nr:LysR family transcriptional regulator [Noviherbaspirillum denitrificans]OWW19913.1 LysR family transcriptional regulator [Noviherbaspirillum denitrificans]
MTLKQLEAFYWAATCASFAMAAERLHVTTSSLSKRLAELEESLGVALFDRTGHKAVLTDAGERLLPRASQMLLAAEETRASVSADTRIAGRCLFGVGEFSALTWLPQLASHAAQRFPDLRLEPHVDIGRALDERLLNGALDCAVIAGRSPHELIASHTVGKAHFVWTVSPAVAGKSQRLTERMLQAHPLVTLPQGAGTSRILDEWMLRNDVDPPYRLSCNSWGAIAGLLIEGAGIGFLPEGWAHSLARRGDLRILQGAPALSPLVYTFQKRRNDERPMLAEMLAAVRATIDFARPPRLL